MHSRSPAGASSSKARGMASVTSFAFSWLHPLAGGLIDAVMGWWMADIQEQEEGAAPVILVSRTQSRNEAESAVNCKFANIIAQPNSGLAIPTFKRATG